METGKGYSDEYTLPDMKLGAYYNSDSGTRWADSTIYIPLQNVSEVSFDIAKAYYCSWYVYDDKDNMLQSNTQRGTPTISCNFNVKEYEYIKIAISTNGSGSANCSIRNFKAN